MVQVVWLWDLTLETGFLNQNVGFYRSIILRNPVSLHLPLNGASCLVVGFSPGELTLETGFLNQNVGFYRSIILRNPVSLHLPLNGANCLVVGFDREELTFECVTIPSILGILVRFSWQFPANLKKLKRFLVNLRTK